jgi:hypothetical protein
MFLLREKMKLVLFIFPKIMLYLMISSLELFEFSFYCLFTTRCSSYLFNYPTLT